MRPRLARGAAVAILACAGACSFQPDLSRYQPCDAGGPCPEGYQCLLSERLCIPACEDPPLCGAPPPGDGGLDAGLSLTPEALPPAVEWRSYQVTLGGDGGVGPYSFQALGPLPPGLGLTDAGLLSGTPEDAGTYRVTLQVEDRSAPPLRAPAERTLPVRALLRLAGPAALANAAIGQSYSETLSATGGDGGHRFALADGGALPSGLSLAQNGTITGSPQDGGALSFDVEVTDGDQPPQRAVRRISMNVVVLPLTLQLATQGLPDGRLGTAYSYRLQRLAGTGPSTWTLTAGALPPNVGLDTASGVISGAPAARGKSTFTVQLSDSVTSAQATFSIDVY